MNNRAHPRRDMSNIFQHSLIRCPRIAQDGGFHHILLFARSLRPEAKEKSSTGKKSLMFGTAEMCLPQPASHSSAVETSCEDTTQPPVYDKFVPEDAISRSAYAYASQHLHPAVLTHSLRVYCLAAQLATKQPSKYASEKHQPLLFTACVFHDVGTAAAHDGSQRFEVEGADAASAFLRSHGVRDDEAHDVWVAIALHTSPGIAERISDLARLVRVAVLADFKRPASLEEFSGAYVQAIERSFPRLNIEKILGDVVVEQALRQREKAPPASWPGVLLRSKLENPDWDGVNKAF
ncbi:uncharacterized protein PV09_08251 [Verruconis gallopava]|uniref:HD/PDEase domain-containing protein n=1 Tax=Verruconis gallopava TaxID=253628 RepID=A0A0D1XDA1_9PEZI|nr:uncharacterized protein PV09_08251 [Verruconis gallopava]KIW00211.1 hypothetical protein PV09_08251 [Verruconis gallopava]